MLTYTLYTLLVLWCPLRRIEALARMERSHTGDEYGYSARRIDEARNLLPPATKPMPPIPLYCDG